MLSTLYAEFIVALSWVFLSNVYSQSTDCGHVNVDLQNTNEEGAWPWMAAITKKEGSGDYSFRCNGFLIDRRHVLTAAHCYDKIYDVSDFLIRIGNKNWNEGDVFEVTCINKHPRYESGLFYDDIAIVTLSRDVHTPNYTPICIPDDNLRVKNMRGDEVTKIAWGALKLRGRISDTLIQNAGLRIISNKDCNKTFKKLMGRNFRRQFPGEVSGDMVCAENPTEQTESCGGDGGSPLMYRDKSKKWIAVGITSYGYSCGISPTGSTRVSAYLEWIIENTMEDKDDCNGGRWFEIFESQHNPR